MIQTRDHGDAAMSRRWTRARRRLAARPRAGRIAAAILVGALSLAGCASGPTGTLPPVTDPSNAADVTFYRSASIVGLFAPIVLEINGRDAAHLWVGKRHSFRLDPGEYTLDYTIGFNECRAAILVYAGHAYRYRLLPNCYMEREMLDYPAYGAPAYAEPYAPAAPGAPTGSGEGIESTSLGQLYGG